MFIKERGKVDEGKDKKVKKRGKNNIKCSLKLRQTRTLKLRQVEAIKKCKKKTIIKEEKTIRKTRRTAAMKKIGKESKRRFIEGSRAVKIDEICCHKAAMENRRRRKNLLEITA